MSYRKKMIANNNNSTNSFLTLMKNLLSNNFGFVGMLFGLIVVVSFVIYLGSLFDHNSDPSILSLGIMLIAMFLAFVFSIVGLFKKPRYTGIAGLVLSLVPIIVLVCWSIVMAHKVNKSLPEFIQEVEEIYQAGYQAGANAANDTIAMPM